MCMGTAQLAPYSSFNRGWPAYFRQASPAAAYADAMCMVQHQNPNLPHPQKKPPCTHMPKQHCTPDEQVSS